MQTVDIQTDQMYECIKHNNYDKCTPGMQQK